LRILQGMESMQLGVGEEAKIACDSIVIVPEKAMQEGGYIKTLTVQDAANAKHEYHALAQMAYFQYQDEELEVRDVGGLAVVLEHGDERIVLESGCMIARTATGELVVLIRGMINKKKILEAAYRYCTRWVRLDI